MLSNCTTYERNTAAYTYSAPHIGHLASMNQPVLVIRLLCTVKCKLSSFSDDNEFKNNSMELLLL